MEKVLFVMKYPLVDSYSVKGKFNGQMKAVERLGYDVYYLAFDHEAFYLVNKDEHKIIKNVKFAKSKHYIHTKVFYDLYNCVKRVLRQERFDMAYIRYAPLSFNGVSMLRRLKMSTCKTVVEIPTYPPEVGKATALIRRIYLKYSMLCWKIANKYLSLYALIGEKATIVNGVPAINICNGSDVESVNLRQPQFDDNRVHILAVAAMSVWHGYDRMIKGIATLDKDFRDRIVFDMVGNEGDGSLTQWKQLVEELGLEKQVIFHGRKMGEELDPFYEKADVGICSLGMYRIGFESGSILKLREYSARGLPFVYAANDPALPTEQKFALKVPNDDTPIDVKQVIDFALALRNEEDIPIQMREYARNVMSWESQMKLVFDALK